MRGFYPIHLPPNMRNSCQFNFMVECDHEDFVQARKQMQFRFYLQTLLASKKSLESVKMLVGLNATNAADRSATMRGRVRIAARRSSRLEIEFICVKHCAT